MLVKSNSQSRITPFKQLIQNWATAIDETKQLQNENLQKLLAIKTRKLSSATASQDKRLSYLR